MNLPLIPIKGNKSALDAIEQIIKGDAPALTVFIGSCGAGKTAHLQHLAELLGSEVIKSPEFFETFINRLQENRAEDLMVESSQKKVLIMDDLDYFKNKKGTQAFFLKLIKERIKRYLPTVIALTQLEYLEGELADLIGTSAVITLDMPDVDERCLIFHELSARLNFQLKPLTAMNRAKYCDNWHFIIDSICSMKTRGAD